MEWLFLSPVVVGFFVFIALIEGAAAEVIDRILSSLLGGRPAPKSLPATKSDNNHQVAGSEGSEE